MAVMNILYYINFLYIQSECMTFTLSTCTNVALSIRLLHTLVRYALD